MGKHGNNDWLRGFFADQDVFIIGSGKSADSLTLKQINKLQKSKTIVMGNRAKQFKSPSIFLFLDSDLIERLDMPGAWPYGESFHVLAGPQSRMVEEANVHRFGQVHDIVSQNPSYLLCDHSGLAAVNAAFIGRARRVFLVGVDCGFGVWKASGTPPTLQDPDFKLMRRYMSTVPLFEKLHKKMQNLYRTTDDTNLKFLPFMDLDVALAGQK